MVRAAEHPLEPEREDGRVRERSVSGGLERMALAGGAGELQAFEHQVRVEAAAAMLDERATLGVQRELAGKSDEPGRRDDAIDQRDEAMHLDPVAPPGREI